MIMIVVKSMETGKRIGKVSKQDKFDRRGFLKSTTAIAAATAVGTLLPTALVRAQQVKWKHGVVTAKADAGFFWMAQEQGYFNKRGLDVEFVQFRSDLLIVQAMLAGDLDSGEPNPGIALNAIDRGANLRFIGSTMPGYGFAMYVRKDITNWDQLKGKTFGVPAPGSTPDIMIRAMLARKGIDTDSVNIANAGGSSAGIQALIAGKIDGAAASTQFIPDADKLGIRVMARADELLPEYPRFVIVAREQTLKAKREAAISFLAGYMEGLDYAAKHRDETLKLAGKINHMPANDAQLVFVYDETIAKGYLAVKLEVPKAKINWLQQELLKMGVIKKAIDLDKYIDETYREEALKRVSF